MKTKLLIPVILATVMMIGATFAVTPVQKASTVHTTILAAISGANNPANRVGNATFKETLRGYYSWTVAAAATTSNGTLLINFAQAGTPGGAIPTKVTGFLSVVNRNATLATGGTQGGLAVYSGNGTALLAAVKSGDSIKSTFITLGGTGLDIRANETSAQTGTVKFQVVKVD